MKIPSSAILIPARLDGVRLPRKVLHEFYGLPMIEHVRRRALMNGFGAPVFVATGDEEIIDCVKSFGGSVIRTLGEHKNGTSRCAEAAEFLDFENIVIAQGDEILLLPRHLNSVLSSLSSKLSAHCLNSVAPITEKRDLYDLSIVKCLIAVDNQVKMMFRNPPISKHESLDLGMFKKVLGLFAFRKDALLYVSRIGEMPFETLESIEQMKIIESNYQIEAIELDKAFHSLNVFEDIELIENSLSTDSEQNEVLQSILSAKKS